MIVYYEMYLISNGSNGHKSFSPSGQQLKVIH